MDSKNQICNPVFQLKISPDFDYCIERSGTAQILGSSQTFIGTFEDTFVHGFKFQTNKRQLRFFLTNADSSIYSENRETLDEAGLLGMIYFVGFIHFILMRLTHYL